MGLQISPSAKLTRYLNLTIAMLHFFRFKCGKSALELQKAAMSGCFLSSSPVPAVLVLLCGGGGGGGGGHVHDGGGAPANGPHRLVSKDLKKKKKERGLFKTGNNSSTFGYNGVVEHKAPPLKFEYLRRAILSPHFAYLL